MNRGMPLPDHVCATKGAAVPVLDHKGATTPPPDLISDSVLLDLSAVRQGVDTMLSGFLDVKEQHAPGAELPPLIALLRRFLVGGKRLRPLLCVCGWYAGGGEGDQAAVIRAAAGLELFQAFALIHDDVMDASDTRRGRPTAHRALAAAYAADGGRADRSQQEKRVTARAARGSRRPCARCCAR